MGQWCKVFTLINLVGGERMVLLLLSVQLMFALIMTGNCGK